jgi:hypothetical protein
MRLGGLRERHRATCRFLQSLAHTGGRIAWQWDRAAWRAAVQRDGAYLLRAHWPGQRDAAQLWDSYIQLTEAEAAFRSLKSELGVRPIWHWKEPRVEAHVMVAFLGYAMWVCLKKRAAARAPSLTPWQILQHLRAIVLVEVEFDTRDGRTLTLPRITEPENEQAALLLQLGWTLPQQPPPRIRQAPKSTD